MFKTRTFLAPIGLVCETPLNALFVKGLMYSPFGTQHGHGQAHIYMVHTKSIGAAPPGVRTPDAGAFPVQWSLVRFPACHELGRGT